MNIQLGRSARDTAVLFLGSVLCTGLIACDNKAQDKLDVSQTPTTTSENDAASQAGTLSEIEDQSKPGLARLHAAIEEIPDAALIQNNQRLEKIRAWLAEHGSKDITPFQLEIQAQGLAIQEVFLQRKGSNALQHAQWESEYGLLRAWSADANSDGQLSDAEIEQIAALQNTSISHPYFRTWFDTNTDGEVTTDEIDSGIAWDHANDDILLTKLAERELLEIWDTNGDGLHSDQEQSDGKTSTLYDQNYDYVISPEEWAEGKNNTEYDLDDELTKEIIETKVQDFYRHYGFTARKAYVSIGFKVEKYTRGKTREETRSNSLRARHQSAIREFDTDGDNLLTPTEWEQGIDALRSQRDRRTFNHFYDRDDSGHVDDQEVARFMDRYDAGSLAADANLDGDVTISDIAYFMDMFSRQ